MNKLVLFGFLALMLTQINLFQQSAEANSMIPMDEPSPRPSSSTTPSAPAGPELKQVHFVIECTASDSGNDGGSCGGSDGVGCRKIRIYSEFEKMVTIQGGEYADSSAYPFNPLFEIEANGSWIQKGYGLRFTEILGTRIQSEIGSYPALVLPRGALNAYPHSVDGKLELGFSTVAAKCFIFSR